MRNIFGLTVISLLSLLCGACGSEATNKAAEKTAPVLPQPDEATATSSPADTAQSSVVGIWELRYQDAVGQSYLNVLELRDDGTYATHMQDATPSDAGRYSVSETALSLESAVGPQFSRDILFSMEEDHTLKLFLTAPGVGEAVAVDWTRSELRRRLRTMEWRGQRAPGELPNEVTAFLGEAQNWRADAAPTAIRIEAAQNGEFKTVLHFFSPSTTQELRMTITPFDVKSSIHDGARAKQIPLPPEFMDLPLILIKATESEFDGAIEKADLQVWGEHGPVWRLRYANQQGGAFSATSGERISGDVTGYIAQYEANWNYAGELWRKALERYRPKPESSGAFDDYDISEPDCHFYCDRYDTSTTCRNAGGTWKGSVDPGTNGSCS